MHFYRLYTKGRYLVTTTPMANQSGNEIYPRDLPETGILGATYDAGFSDGVELGADGWQAVREQLIAERDALCNDNKSLTIQRDALATSRDNAVSASQHIAENLEKEKQLHLAAIMQRNSYRTELDQEVERGKLIAGERDSLLKARDRLVKSLARVSADRAELDQCNFAQSNTIQVFREEVADLRRSLSNVCAARDRLQETVEELKEQNTDLLRCVDTAQERDRQLNESLNRMVAHRDRLEKQLREELATVYSGSKGYAEGLNNGKGYALTEISNHCRELRAKLPGEY